MSIYTKISEDFRFLQFKKAKSEEESNKLNTLKLIYAEFQRRPNLKVEPTDDYSISVLKKYLKNNDELLKHISDPIQIQDIKIENSIIESYLPQSASEEEIKDFLFSQSIDPRQKNKYIGITIKHFKDMNVMVNGADVKKILDSILGE